MSDTVSKFFFDETFGGQEEDKKESRNVEDLLDNYKLLSLEEKLAVKRLINNLKLF